MMIHFYQSNGCAETSMSMSCMETYRIFLELFFIMGVDWIVWVTTLFIFILTFSFLYVCQDYKPALICD